MSDTPDVHIKHLDVTFEVDHQGGEAMFASLFATYVRRWHEALLRAETDRRFAETERSTEQGQ